MEDGKIRNPEPGTQNAEPQAQASAINQFKMSKNAANDKRSQVRRGFRRRRTLEKRVAHSLIQSTTIYQYICYEPRSGGIFVKEHAA